MAVEAAEAVAAPSEVPAQTPSQTMEDRFQSLVDRGALDTAAAPTAAPEASEAATEATTAEDTEPEYDSLEGYLAHAKLEPNSFYELPVSVKIDGKQSTVPLKDVLKSYQLEGHVQQKSIALAEQQRQWEGERAAVQQALGQQLQMAQTLGNLAHQQLLADYQGIDWNRLRAEDPAGWAVKNQEFQNRANQIGSHLQAVQQRQQQLEFAQRQEMETKILPAEQEKLFEARPAWRDAKQFETARTELRGAGKQLGFTDAELSGISDHRQMIALDLAAQMLKLQAAQPGAVKRVRTAPQIAQPGARITRDPKAVAHQQAREVWARNPRSDDAAAAVFERYA